MTIRADEAKIVREVARRVLGGESLRRVAFDLNAREVRTCSGNPWRVTSLRGIITNPRYAGLRVHRGEVVGDATWKPILDRASHERIRAILTDPRRTRRGRPAVHVLAGLLRCGRCGEQLYTNHRRNGTRRYICHTQPHAGCGGIAITAEPLEELVTGAVLQRLDSPVMRNAVRKRDKRATSKSDDGVERLADVERELEELARDYGEQRITRREWLAAREPLEKRRNRAIRAIERESKTHVLHPLRDVDVTKMWTKLNLDRRRAVLAALIDHVTISPATQKKFDSDRVDVHWRV
jgi:hypothetical protein